MSHKTWGGRFSKELDPRVMHFNASLAFDRVLYAHDISGSQAHATMLAQQGLILYSEAELICQALAEIGYEIEHGIQEFDESCEDIHMFIEQLLIAKIGDVGKNYTREEAVMIKWRLIYDCMRVMQEIRSEPC